MISAERAQSSANPPGEVEKQSQLQAYLHSLAYTDRSAASRRGVDQTRGQVYNSCGSPLARQPKGGCMGASGDAGCQRGFSRRTRP